MKIYCLAELPSSQQKIDKEYVSKVDRQTNCTVGDMRKMDDFVIIFLLAGCLLLDACMIHYWLSDFNISLLWVSCGSLLGGVCFRVLSAWDLAGVRPLLCLQIHFLYLHPKLNNYALLNNTSLLSPKYWLILPNCLS